MTVDYKDFLGKVDIHVAPCFENNTLWLGERPVRAPVYPGWWRVLYRGRKLEDVRPAEPQEIAEWIDPPRRSDSQWTLRKVHGHLARVGGDYYLCQVNDVIERVNLPPEEEPALLSPHVARRWPSGDLVWGELGWEDGAEDACRQRLESDQTLGTGAPGDGTSDQLKNVHATLRAAWALSVIDKAARDHRTVFSPGEVLGALEDVLRRGLPAARLALARLIQARAAANVVATLNALRPENRALAAPPPVVYQPAVQPQDDLEGRLEAALRGSGARYLAVRRLENGRAEVTWSFQGERLMSIVARDTLRIIDAGICLSDHVSGVRGDDRFTIASLPGVVDEAIRTRRLVVTRREAGGWDDDPDEE